MSKTGKTVAGIIVVVVLILIISNISKPAGAKTVKIGAALGLTGECANYGEGELKSTQLAIDEANKNGGIMGRNIELSTEDTQCDPKGAVNAIKKLVEVDKVEAIVGLTWGDSYQAGYSVNNAAKIVSVAPSAALEALRYNNASIDYIFSTWFPEKAEIDALQKRASDSKLKNLIVIHDNDTFGAMMASLFETRAPQSGLNIVKDYKLPIDTDDFRTILTEAKSLNSDGMALFFQTPASKAKVMKQAHDLGIKTKFFTSADIEDPSLLNNFGGVMEGITYTYPEVTGDKDSFMQKFKAQFGTDSVGASDANAYDATRVVITALTDHYKNNTDMKSAVQNVDIPGTAVKDIKFDDSHQITGAQFEIKTVHNGQFITAQ